MNNYLYKYMNIKDIINETEDNKIKETQSRYDIKAM